jgi:CheY-like chemotaxis protein
VVVVTQQILIAEDEAALRYIYDRILSSMGFTVLQAKNGQEAIDLLREQTPVLIFLDMLMPHVNGVQVLDYIATQPRLQQTYVVIASSASDYEKYALHRPATEFRLKPILPTHIREIALRHTQPQPK